MTWREAEAATGGRLLSGAPDAPVGRVTTDSRGAAAGEVFLALRGPRFDAHDFLDARLAGLCSGWVVRRGAALPAARPAAVLEVPDTLAALGSLAAAHRARFDIPIVGVTGSNGKTTVKEMLRAALSARGPVCATEGNLNNEVGLPLCVLGLGPEHRFGVFELGASKRGDIALLARVARPTAAVLTNIAPAHLEFFGDLETVFATKSELVSALPPGAPVALCGDDPMLRRLLPRLGPRAWTFGAGEANRVHPLPGPAPRLSVDGEALDLPPSWPAGGLHRLNACAAAALARALGLSPSEIAAGLAGYRPAPLRFAERRHPSGARLVVDAYNANPGSMRAGVETFLETAPESARYVVLGDMKELGPGSERLHAELGAWLAGLPLAGAFLAGPDMRAAAAALAGARAAFPVEHADDPAALAAPVRARLAPGAAVYLKASRAMRLETLAESL